MMLVPSIAVATQSLYGAYLQFPPGSNNRLDEGTSWRNNNNRLFDSKNYAGGGYGYGGDSNNPATPLSFIAGSRLELAWSSQYGCDSSTNADCQLIIQYMCNDGATPPPGVLAMTDTRGHSGALAPLSRARLGRAKVASITPVCLSRRRCGRGPAARRHQRQYARPEQPAGHPRPARAHRLLQCASADAPHGQSVTVTAPPTLLLPRVRTRRCAKGVSATGACTPPTRTWLVMMRRPRGRTLTAVAPASSAPVRVHSRLRRWRAGFAAPASVP